MTVNGGGAWGTTSCRVTQNRVASVLLRAIFPKYPPQDPYPHRKPGDVPRLSPAYHRTVDRGIYGCAATYAPTRNVRLVVVAAVAMGQHSILSPPFRGHNLYTNPAQNIRAVWIRYLYANYPYISCQSDRLQHLGCGRILLQEYHPRKKKKKKWKNRLEKIYIFHRLPRTGNK